MVKSLSPPPPLNLRPPILVILVLIWWELPKGLVKRMECGQDRSPVALVSQFYYFILSCAMLYAVTLRNNNYAHTNLLAKGLHLSTCVIYIGVIVECPTLVDPVNGDIALSGNTPGSSASYTCISGYTVDGNDIRFCQGDGTWTGTDPICRREPQLPYLHDTCITILLFLLIISH